MSEVKRFRISGEIRKRGESLPFLKEFNAVKPDDAVESLYADLGSRHKARRFEIRVQKVEEVSLVAEQS